MNFLSPNHPRYPKLNPHFNRKPVFGLSCPFSFSDQPLVAVVGARNMRPWVRDWLEHELDPVLNQTPWVVMSGGARGVDQAAHGLALRKNKQTLMVLPRSFQDIYPKSLEPYARSPGAVLMYEASSEDNNKSVQAYQFYRRNECIVALSSAVLIVQAAEKSGSMLTARIARDWGVPLATLPASPMDRDFSGNNTLLYEGACMVRDAQDLRVFLASASGVNSSCVSLEKDPMEA